MPELPEVETIAQELIDQGLEGNTVESVHLSCPKLPPNLIELERRTVQRVDRRGKWLVWHLCQGTLLIHLRMSGKLVWSAVSNRHTRMIIWLASGESIQFDDPRKFGRCLLTERANDILGCLGPEPLDADFTPSILMQRIRNRRRAIKPLLLDQSVIAGLGNIYVDEALWEAKIHPLRSAASLELHEMKQLHRAIQTVLSRGIKYRGTSLRKGASNYTNTAGEKGGHQTRLLVFRQEGTPCIRCKTLIQKIRVGQRGTHYCAHCQRYD